MNDQWAIFIFVSSLWYYPLIDYWYLLSIFGSYKLQMDIIRLDFKSGLEALLKAKPIRAFFLGVRIGDPTAVCDLPA